MKKRNQDELSDREKAETHQMEAAGFVWDPARGYSRWTHERVEVTALREPWMRDPDWDKRRAAKIAEAARLRRFDDLPLGARFRMISRIATDRRVFIKLGRVTFVPWESLDTQQVRTDVDQAYFRIVELFEPFHDLQPSELAELPNLPGVWQALADWHANQSAEAESQDWVEPMQWHDVREKACKDRAAELLKRWEDS